MLKCTLELGPAVYPDKAKNSRIRSATESSPPGHMINATT